MEEKTLKRLEYNKVLEQLASFAGSPLGKERALDLRPVDDPAVINRWQDEVSEGRMLLRMEPTAEMGGWKDIRNQLQRAGRGAVLEPEELIAVADTLTAGRIMKNFLAERQETYPLLNDHAFFITPLPDLEKRIKKAILPGGEIADNASPELAQTRRKLAAAQLNIKNYIENLIRSPNYQKYLQDPIVTIREGRYVVPVKIEYRAQVPGIIHDQSASGATIFVEPMAVVDKNNEIRRLAVAEKQEIQRILAGLSEGVAQDLESIETSLQTLGELDFIMARARYSQHLDAWAPVLADEAVLDIRQGRHPLLKGDVVPVNIRLGEDFDTLVITGPNTGGKTVTLKTAGLHVLMAQSGLHIPAGENSRLGIFQRVFTDIGDEQSIEQSLSTFSSHMTNIVEIVSQAGRDSLVLLDELGAGTDPVEGAALAQSILEKLHSAGARTIATTHYSELKNFAYARERVENASVEFDTATLRPTYRLLIGKPGRSNAFEIALKLGLPAGLIKRARKFLSVEQIQFEELMRNLEKAQQEAEADREAAAKLADEARAIKDKHEKLAEDLAQRREAILSKAGEEARSLVKSARMEAEFAVRELREKIAEESTRARESAIQEARDKLGRLHHKVSRAVPEKVFSGQVPTGLRAGQEVLLPRFNQRGYVIEPPGPGEDVQVQVGILKMNVPLKDLRTVEKPKTGGGQSEVAGMILDKARDISVELDLRGQYAEEAVLLVEKYLDDADLAGLPRVSLIHGKGTGSLRTAVHKLLKGHRRVKSFRLGEHGEGGYGVTIVELAK
ncbi:endonuclease MutS2 [Pelotomaculum propionicicum]|uniref:endonuclease MutS2 n=1 Tax=Pelotomaculum propionicicum TaxID=258475 RepID=UPI003B770147